jgi:hypothetical protein
MVGGDSDRELGWLGWRLTSLCAKENQSYRDGLPALLFVHIDGDLVREVVLDTRDDPDGLEVLVFLISVFDGEEALVGIFDFAEAGAAIGCKLICDLASLLGGFFNHLWLDFVQLCEQILRA